MRALDPLTRSSSPPAADPDDTPMTGTYLLVLLVEAVVIAALWALGRQFG